MAKDIDDVLLGWTESERSGDTTQLHSLLTDDFVGIGPVGFVLDKDAWIGRFDRGLHYDRLDLDEVSTRRHGDTAIVVAHQHAVGHAGEHPTPTDLRVSFTVVPGDDAALRIAGMQYSFIGMPGMPGSQPS